MDQQALVRALVDRHGRTLAEEAGISLRDKPSPLWRLLVLSLLLSARISAGIALASARELSRAGYRTPERMRAATWQQRVDALGRGGYRRYDEKTSTMLGELAETVLSEYAGDLRHLHEQAGDTAGVETALQRFKGIGPTGARIFCREVQAVWTDLAPYVDPATARGAERLGLPSSAHGLARLVGAGDLPRLVAGSVRAAREDAVVEDVGGHVAR